MGREGENVNGERYAPRLQNALQTTLLDPAGQWCGINPGKGLRPEVEDWIAEHGVDVPWVWKEALSAANVNGQLGPFFRALRQREVTVVGGPHLMDLPKDVVGHTSFVEVHESEAWKRSGLTARCLLRSVHGGEVVLFCAGMASNLMIHGLCQEGGRSDLTLIDLGACLDPYVGVHSRKGYRTTSFQNKAMQNNL